MRRPIALLAAVLLAAVLAVPVEAATLQRTFRASMGSSGANGTIQIDYKTDGTGLVTYNLTGLRRNAGYHVEVWKGRCGNLKTVAKRLLSIKTSSSGTVKFARAMGVSQAYPVWEANWSSLLAFRLVSGSSIRCGNVSFTRATRVSIPAYSINLPVVRGPSSYPYCNVAMYLGSLSQPVEPGVTYLYAHARKGMFYPLYYKWKTHQASSMVGRTVYVYTSDSMRHTYVISWVKVMKSVQSAVGISSERLWLQTSTGPNFTYPKLVLSATRTGSAPTTYAASHPTAHPVRCG